MARINKEDPLTRPLTGRAINDGTEEPPNGAEIGRTRKAKAKV